MAIICDFCSDPNPEWAFPAKDFEMEGGPEAGGFQGGWAACEACKRLIDRSDYNGLAKRSAEKFVGRPAGLSIDHLIPSLRKLHRRFRQNRTGPPRRLTKADKASGKDPTAKSKAASVELKFDREGNVTEVEGQPSPGLSIDPERVEWPEASQNAPFSKEAPVIREVREGSESFFMEEGFSPEQLKDPRVIQRIMEQVKPGEGVDTSDLTRGLTTPIRFPEHWEGARTFHKVVAAVIGELPRSEDRWTPSPAMMNSRQIIEPMARAHPLIIEPDQMNAIDDSDWSLSEAHDYARMCHLPFEPLYLDFGGHNGGITVTCSLGEAQMYGALIWRDDMWKDGPALGVAPFGAWTYLNKVAVEHVQKKYGLTQDQMIHLTGGSCWYPGKSDRPTGQSIDLRTGRRRTYRVSEAQAMEQWQYQTPGLMFFGPTFAEANMWATATIASKNEGGEWPVERVFAMPEAFHLIDEERIQTDPKKLGIVAITGLKELGIRTGEETPGDRDGGHFVEVSPENNAFKEMLALNAELIGRMSERALLGLYFIENAPVEISAVPLSRQVKRQMMREGKEHVASIVVIRPSSGGKRNKDAEASERDYKYRWERRGYFMHIHSNNRHYQNRPDLVRPCHRCEREYAKGTEGVESPDCIKKWVEPVVCGPEHLPLRQKVRVKRKGPS